MKFCHNFYIVLELLYYLSVFDILNPKRQHSLTKSISSFLNIIGNCLIFLFLWERTYI